MRASIALFLALGLALTGCPDTPAPPDAPKPTAAPKPPTPPKAPAAPAAPETPKAPDEPDPVKEMAKAIKDKLGFEVCTKYADETCQDPADTFTADTAVLHAVLVTTQVPRKEGKYAIKWICEDSAGAAPPNYVIETTRGDLAEILRKVSTHITVHGQLSKPTKGWPKGAYRVEVHLDGKQADTKKFTIE